MRRMMLHMLGIWCARRRESTLESAGEILGRLMWLALPARRRTAIRALEHHLRLPPDAASKLAWDNFRHTGRSFLEIMHTRKMDHRFLRDRVRIEGEENLERVIRLQRPIVGVSAHLGAWELLSGLLALSFHERGAQIVVRQPKDPLLKELMTHFRQRDNVEIVSRKLAAPKVQSNLKKKGISAFLVDHNCGRDQAVFLPFFQEYAAVNMGPALLALRSRAVVWPVFMLREDGNYAIHCGEPLDTRTVEGTLRERVEQVAAFYTREVEAMVRRYPEQWFWMHRRWKTRPDWEKRP
ncbi:MAG: lysophospholipid acyltransferase family protein [Desulfohalobiaceae bacterium]|nr:lysophospholipid acyltransferase family protein [Desulfohalobiaceae bacterium]